MYRADLIKEDNELQPVIVKKVPKLAVHCCGGCQTCC